MHPSDCPAWEYESFTNHEQIVGAQSEAVVKKLRKGELDTVTLAADSRHIHEFIFRSLTPKGHEYFAGHYRGEPFRCLRYYLVHIKGDPSVGYPPDSIPLLMRDVSRDIRASIAALDAAHTVPNKQLAPEDKLYYTVVVACQVFELVLRIHPYANGNGHSARFIVWAILGRYGYWPRDWPIEPRPANPPYVDLIVNYRNGNRLPLERYIVQNIIGR